MHSSACNILSSRGLKQTPSSFTTAKSRAYLYERPTVQPPARPPLLASSTTASKRKRKHQTASIILDARRGGVILKWQTLPRPHPSTLRPPARLAALELRHISNPNADHRVARNRPEIVRVEGVMLPAPARVSLDEKHPVLVNPGDSLDEQHVVVLIVPAKLLRLFIREKQHDVANFE
ncbi:hypothetical protein THAOC_01535 [Thalassiosira oceanica]|uniref:Uncharacterized protein n=1 Tax=Thalassiosira oceanica TaxID=159749 RepID=K0TI85_THAOC|nr:hypothetical protein THAOC_01535 [Thalassiosira oceanica]|eukprot:EJK76689.1 hypothetical protein THAOC_01535 [Thalassiosira oceanica]